MLTSHAITARAKGNSDAAAIEKLVARLERRIRG
jgi:ribosome-associated translation inhibitor RaiA